MLRPAVLLLILSLLQSVATAQPTTESHEQLRKAYEQRNYLSVVAELREIERRDPAAYAANNYDYLLARVSEKIGDAASAMASYQAVVNRKSVLKDHALWHLARLARASGGLMLERIYLQRLAASSSDSLLQFPSNRRIAQSWFDSGNYDLALRANDRRSTRAVKAAEKNSARDAERARQVFAGEAYLFSGDVSRAREIFTAVSTNLANASQPDDFALDAVRGLDGLDGADLPKLSAQEHMRRASIYQFNRDFQRARIHYGAIIQDHPSSELVPEAIFQTGRGYVQQSDFTEALKWFERSLEQFPGHQTSAENLIQSASAYSRVGKAREAVLRYKKYIADFPQGERIDRAYLNVIDVLRDQREETEALKWAASVREKFRGRQPEALAMFAEARMYLARTDWTNALATLERLEALPDLGGSAVPGGTTIAEVRFLRGFSLEGLRRFAEAIDIYLAIPDGRNEYYGWRATERLRMMAADPTAGPAVRGRLDSLKSQPTRDAEATRKNLQSMIRLTDKTDERDKQLATLRTTYAALPAYRSPVLKFVKPGRQNVLERPATAASSTHRAIADELLFLGLYDEAAPELEVSGIGGYTLAAVSTRGDLANRGFEFIDSTWKPPADYQVELIPVEVSELLYPAAFADELIRFAPQRNVDPRFLLAIMRQESRYRPDVKSFAAARGLMQFISTTSTRVAGELERENFQQDDLYDPATAILFGAHYTGNLFKLFPNQPAAVSASYNGGEDNMRRWFARAKSEDADRYIAEISYAQSKDYAYRVLANYRVYKLLYDENLNRR